MNSALSRIIEQVLGELANAQDWFPPFQSRHEGIAVIREEYLELEKGVFCKRVGGLTRSEALQLAAMAIRFVLDCEEPA